MSNTVDTTVKSAVRNSVAATRYMEKLQEVSGQGVDGECSSLCIIRCGEKAIVGGQGKMFSDFLASKQLTGLFRPEESYLSVSHPKYEEANLQVLRFDQCFKKLPYDASHREYPSMFDMFSGITLR